MQHTGHMAVCPHFFGKWG